MRHCRLSVGYAPGGMIPTFIVALEVPIFTTAGGTYIDVFRDTFAIQGLDDKQAMEVEILMAFARFERSLQVLEADIRDKHFATYGDVVNIPTNETDRWNRSLAQRNERMGYRPL